MADLEAHVPERIEEAVHQRGQGGTGLAVDNAFAVVQEHDVNIAVGIQLGAAIAADGDKGQDRWRTAGQRRRGVFNAL